MASTPNFPAALRYGVAKLTTGNSNRDGTGTIATVLTGAATGTVVRNVMIKAETDLADSIVILWLSDDGGTTWRIFDEQDAGNPAAGSTTVTAYELSVNWSTLYLPSASHRLGATITVTPTTGACMVHAFGADF